MLLTFEETALAISKNKPMQIAGSEDLLIHLPEGNWIGGSTEYFMTQDGGKICDDKLFVTEYPYRFSIKTYDEVNIKYVAEHAYDYGFSILILPFDSAVHKEFAQNASAYPYMLMKNIVGWVSGTNLYKKGQTPITVNGATGEVFSDRAVALHFKVPENKTVSMNIVNIMEPDENSPVIEFREDGFAVHDCYVDGKAMAFAGYIARSGIDTQFPLVREYSGNGINTSFKSIQQNGVVNFYTPVFAGVKYRFAKSISNYADAFNARIGKIKNTNAVFSCNCILNFLYGNLEDKKLDAFTGPVTFGEIAYQLVNQTLVYVTVEE